MKWLSPIIFPVRWLKIEPCAKCKGTVTHVIIGAINNSYTALRTQVSTAHVNKVIASVLYVIVIIGDRFVKSELPMSLYVATLLDLQDAMYRYYHWVSKRQLVYAVDIPLLLVLAVYSPWQRTPNSHAKNIKNHHYPVIRRTWALQWDSWPRHC